MPLQEPMVMSKGNGDNQTRVEVTAVFSMLDRQIADLSKARGLPSDQVRLLRSIHVVVFLGDSDVFVVSSVNDLGIMPERTHIDWTGKPMDMDKALLLAERDFDFRGAFGFQFPKDVLTIDSGLQEELTAQIAEQYIESEIDYLERQSGIVKIDPIFGGREFLLNEQMVFVLSPFGDPFDMIYKDHLKPSVESQGLECKRADDIYDNRPIMEDIWQYINEARLVIAELTGRNANVFYETGVAHTVGKEVVLVTQSMEDVPFDLRHLRCIVYEFTPRPMTAFEENLKNTISTILNRRT